MKMKMGISGVDQLVAQLRNMAVKVPETARKTMHRGADKIVEEAKLNAPVDKHNLEASIKKEVSYGDHGRLQIDIVVGGVVNGVDVDQYAMLVHENYESMTPGPGTIAKQKANPWRLVGGRFLERAVQKYREKLARDVILAVIQGIKES